MRELRLRQRKYSVMEASWTPQKIKMVFSELPKVQKFEKQLSLKYSAFLLLLAISRNVKKNRRQGFMIDVRAVVRRGDTLNF